jgi:hypothetical protein
MSSRDELTHATSSVTALPDSDKDSDPMRDVAIRSEESSSRKLPLVGAAEAS